MFNHSELIQRRPRGDVDSPCPLVREFGLIRDNRPIKMEIPRSLQILSKQNYLTAS